MAWRFFRRFGLLPGVTLNISKSGPSLSFGPRGAKLTVGRRGTRFTVGIPGTGLSHTQILRSPREPIATENIFAEVAPATIGPVGDDPPITLERFGIQPPSTAGRWFFRLAALCLLTGLAAAAMGTEVDHREETITVGAWTVTGIVVAAVGFVCLMIAASLPNARVLAVRELHRRRALLERAVSQLKIYDAEGLKRAFELREQLGLTDREIGLETIRTLYEYADINDFCELIARNDGLLPIPGHDQIVGDEPCYYVSPVYLERHGPDAEGMLYLTASKLLAHAGAMLTVPLTTVAAFHRDGQWMTVQRRDRRYPYRLGFPSCGAAAKAELVIRMLLSGKA